MERETFYFTEEQRGILANALIRLQESPYITEETFEEANRLITYLCEGYYPEEDLI